MRLEIPFYKQTSPLNCGPTALRMVLSYFGKDEEVVVLEARTGIKEGKGISTIQISDGCSIFGISYRFLFKTHSI